MKLNRKEFLKKSGLVLSLLLIPKIAKTGFANQNIPHKKIDITPHSWQDGTWSLDIPGKDAGRKSLFLNQTAFDIWNNINGRRSEYEIASLLSHKYGAPVNETSAAVKEFMQSLRSLGLV